MSIVDKKDTSKAPMILLSVLRGPLGEVSKVLQFGNKKYHDIWNFQHIDDGEDRMLSAAVRHLMAHKDGEVLDPESGIWHLAHAACDVMMALWFAIRESRKDDRVL